MKELIKDVDMVIINELKRAISEHAPMNSQHEGFAVILEEVDEANEEIENIDTALKMLWERVKRNDNAEDEAKMLLNYSRLAAAEIIQVATMAQRFILDLKSKDSRMVTKGE
ncbi:hypothetical protein SAMN05443428_1536 [Caloramator quimbayensis]|uniref:PhoU domain-containing protein n=1 Tax=Caloramator quimbayensis TaxID=1147123 RepID=A0A1T4YGS9_9CLOT|nr:hypothetical protein [Caloramator quimbayensis]SKB01042.1 hypothetical protein SAMN05443428_1536 [Caloramator quimbayensis]